MSSAPSGSQRGARFNQPSDASSFSLFLVIPHPPPPPPNHPPPPLSRSFDSLPFLSQSVSLFTTTLPPPPHPPPFHPSGTGSPLAGRRSNRTLSRHNALENSARTRRATHVYYWPSPYPPPLPPPLCPSAPARRLLDHPPLYLPTLHSTSRALKRKRQKKCCSPFTPPGIL